MARTWLLLGVVVAAVLLAGTVAFLERSGREQGIAPNELFLDRPEVRDTACPSDTTMVWRTNHWDMEIGPVVVQFAGDVVGSNKAVATGTRAGWLVQKIPLRINSAPAATFRIRGYNWNSGAEMSWEGSVSLPPADWPLSERTSVPGQMAFPEGGCYQLFVKVDGAEYGPFGFVVIAGHGR